MFALFGAKIIGFLNGQGGKGVEPVRTRGEVFQFFAILCGRFVWRFVHK